MAAPNTLIPVARPRLPPARAILPYLRQIDGNRWYSNHGPLARLFQSRLAEHWGLADRHVALLSNATSALTISLLASGAPPGTRCLMPSWTFAASACAVRHAGLIPHFVDVCPHRWTPDTAEIRALAGRHEVGAIMVVAPFGAPIDMPEWERVQADTGIPVIIDAAAAFDTLRNAGPMQLGACPVAVSLHATKVFGVGEGGALLCRDPDLIDRVRRMAQFGFLGSRNAVVAGVNAKMSEYAAAVGLAGLDEWPDTRARWCTVLASYRRNLASVPGLMLPPGIDERWASSTLNVLWPHDITPVMEALAAAGVGTVQWWGPGCHAQPAFGTCSAEPLPVTQALGRRTLGLPFWQDLSSTQVETVCTLLAQVAQPVRQLEAA